MAEVFKQFSISLDAKRPTSNRDFEVVDGDNGNVLEITLTDDGIPVDLNGCFILAVFSKSNGRTAAQDNRDNGITVDEEQSNRLYIELYTTSFAPGLVECELEIYSGEEHRSLVTTAKFNFMCRRGIANRDTIAETDEWPVLIEMLDRIEGTEEELHILNGETAQAALLAHSAANRANEAADYAEQINADMEVSEGARKTAEQQRVNAENARASAEGNRVSAENARQSGEASRIGAENARVTAENSRVTAEASRQSAESIRQIEEAKRLQAEQQRKERDSAFSLWEDYDNSKAYVPLNKVAYNGSSYLCIAAARGVSPPNPNYWLLIAAKGADGTGSGDMHTSIYDKNKLGIVDDSQRLGGRLADDFISEETDPTVPDWAKQPEKPEYTPDEVGAALSTHAAQHRQDGSDALTAEDIGAAKSAHAERHKEGGADELTPNDIGAAVPSIAYEELLLSSGWSASLQTLAISCMTENANAIFDISPTATDAQFESGKNANLSPYSQGEGKLTIRARGELPTGDIPITVMILG